MEQIIISSNKQITAHIISERLAENAIEVKDFCGVVGTYVDEYNPDWTLKKLTERVKLGRIQIPSGYKLNDDGTEFIAMSQIERYISGVNVIPSGYRLNNDKTDIVAMTIDEQVTAGLITTNEANTRYIAEAKTKREVLFSTYVDKVNAARWLSMNAEQQSIVSAYRQALCDITKQSGYPATITWPDVPEILK